MKKKEVKPCETLYISCIPPNSCIIPKLFMHFKNYGNIVSIYAFGTNASITFSTKEEAITAYKSPEAFAKNRFVRYHYHLRPDKAEDRLSLLVDKERVQAVVKEVNDKIAQEQRRTIQLQSQLKNSVQHEEDTNPDDNNVEELMAAKSQIQQQLQEFQNELLTAAPERKKEIQGQILENQKMLEEIDSIFQKV